MGSNLVLFISSYYRCCRYRDGCPGRCIVNETNAKTCTEHNHPPEPDRVLVDKFRKALTQRAAQESTDLYTIYWEEASQRHSDASLLYVECSFPFKKFQIRYEQLYEESCFFLLFTKLSQKIYIFGS